MRSRGLRGDSREESQVAKEVSCSLEKLYLGSSQKKIGDVLVCAPIAGAEK